MLALALCGSLIAPAIADSKASALATAMTPTERLVLIRGESGNPLRNGVRTGALGSAGYVPGVPRLGIPALQETDASLGIANPDNVRRRDVATALPSGLSLASTWDAQIAYDNGSILGDEAWRKGFNVLLGPGLNLTREPRGGRDFEYLGEDPLLAGTLAGAVVCGVQQRHVVATMKHFALNDQETGRFTYSAEIGEAGMRESDLLAFEIALERGNPGAVMCAYNRVNGVYACQNNHLLNEILKRDWNFPGWVMSDWGAVRASGAALDGLDQESDAQRDGIGAAFFAIPRERQIDMNRRILRSMDAVGLFDDPPKLSPIDYAAHGQAALEAAQRGIVLLKNDGTLPLSRATPRIAVIGGFADAGVLSGGGSAQVIPVGHPVFVPLGAPGASAAFYDRSPPLDAIRAIAPHSAVSFNDGRYPSEAAALARRADVAVVFATQWSLEGADAPSLSLPDGEDALITAVAAANPRTVVVLETGGPVTMPWLDRVRAVAEAWYPGQRGGEAIANVLFGAVDAEGRLPITFPASEAQLVHPELPGLDRLLSALASGTRGYQTAFALGDFAIAYPDGGDAGYRRFVKDGIAPLFAFGDGLSYTSFHYADFTLHGGKTLTASFSVTNAGSRSGTDTPQLYLTRRLGAPEMRLLGWAKVALRPGERKGVSVTADPRLLADFDASENVWVLREGTYEASLGAASDRLSERATVQVAAQTIKP
ncbi:MAG TPA: glycoside hydrolase family 3 C-terminal domain-containing protein [Candidatus Nitrosotalea sp.]|nr:glycoside hydrolase family 3 C-terminal domain-containing protein [Candidatus Nitrosotalea sp.]